jgi:hypothetical protein
VISIIALFVALGGTSIAAFKLAKNSVGTNQVKNDSLTGTDLNESTFGKVPSAVTADRAGDAIHAATADNADTLSGDPGPFVLGAGLQFAVADELDPTPAAHDQNGIAIPGEGTLLLTCSPSPALTWDDQTGGPTDIWLSNPSAPPSHLTASTIATTPLDSNMQGRTQDVEIWDGNDVVFSFRVSAFYTGTKCEISMFSNIEPNGLSTAAASRAVKSLPTAHAVVKPAGR